MKAETLKVWLKSRLDKHSVFKIFILRYAQKGLGLIMVRRDDLLIGPKERAIEAVHKGDKEKALASINALSEDFRPLHDRYVEWINLLLSYICKKNGEEAVNEAMEQLVVTIYRSRFEKMVGMRYEDLIKTLVSLHRQHYQILHIDEGDEKTVITIDECNVGGLLMKMGLDRKYDALTSKAYSWAFNREGVPYYCIHAAYFNKLFTELGIPVKVDWARQYDGEGKPTGKTCIYTVYRK